MTAAMNRIARRAMNDKMPVSGGISNMRQQKGSELGCIHLTSGGSVTQPVIRGTKNRKRTSFPWRILFDKQTVDSHVKVHVTYESTNIQTECC